MKRLNFARRVGDPAYSAARLGCRPRDLTRRYFPRVGKWNPGFFQALENFTVIFPRLGILALLFFQGLETQAAEPLRITAAGGYSNHINTIKTEVWLEAL